MPLQQPLHLPAPAVSFLHVGQVISKSLTVKRAVYSLASIDSIKSPAVTIRGKNIVVDFNAATLRGTPQSGRPDDRRGLAILVDGSVNVTIKNANIHGYKVAILARNTTGLKLLNCDWSYNWKQRLKSTVDKEDESDWMSFHQNDQDEWIYGDSSFGAGGAYLSGCHQFRVERCVNTGSQCGLMLNRCDHGYIAGNDFSFLSGVGIGLYHSSDNVILGNGLDYCVRGYSHLVYSRGQDSASILVYEQSSRNVIAYNSATRSGDGFFLWAGQSTMDTGEGGCNDNQVFGNDFSHAPTNGIEATFSRNLFAGNRIVECWHGVWGGFSFDSQWIGNYFKVCNQGLAIEHGQNNLIDSNLLANCDDGIAAWMIPHRSPDIEYMKRRDIGSHDLRILRNRFESCTSAVSLKETSRAMLEGNRFEACQESVVLNGDCPQFGAEENAFIGGTPPIGAASSAIHRPQVMQPNGNNNPALPDLGASDFDTPWHPSAPTSNVSALGQGLPLVKPRRAPTTALDHLIGQAEWGREHILIDEWGPYDFRSPKIWRRGKPAGSNASEDGRIHLEIFGPAGKWKTISARGAQVIGPGTGSVPGSIDLKLSPGKASSLQLTLEYSGAQIVTPVGQVIPAGTPYRFIYSQTPKPNATVNGSLTARRHMRKVS